MSEPVVLIASCDAFSDVWPVALQCLNKYWDKCPWKIYTSSGTIPWGANPILTGDLPWVPAMKAAVDKIDEEFVCLWLEDMLMCRQVHTIDCKGAEIFMKHSPHVGAIRLGQGPETRVMNGRNAMVGLFVPMADDSLYRVSTSPTLWRKSYLEKILDNCGETAWDFEVTGSDFSKSLSEEIWMTAHETDVDRPFRQYYTAITRGKWNRGCLNWLKQIGIPEPDISRGVVENERLPL